jgi:hypothetical protein
MPASELNASWPKSPDDAETLARRLRADGHGEQLFAYLCVMAGEQEWPAFIAAIAALCALKRRGVQNMLENYKFDSGWALLYGSTGMPPDLYPLFVEILKTSRRFQGTAAEPRTRRLAIIQQALNSPVLRRFKLAPELRAMLLA